MSPTWIEAKDEKELEHDGFRIVFEFEDSQVEVLPLFKLIIKAIADVIADRQE